MNNIKNASRFKCQSGHLKFHDKVLLKVPIPIHMLAHFTFYIFQVSLSRHHSFIGNTDVGISKFVADSCLSLCTSPSSDPATEVESVEIKNNAGI
jgi:hypothetical protein